LDSLGAIYAGLKGNMAVITIDQDEDAKDASNVIRKKKYSWPNFHDDGDIANALGGTNGIPRTIIADANRQVIYDKTGFVNMQRSSHAGRRHVLQEARRSKSIQW